MDEATIQSNFKLLLNFRDLGGTPASDGKRIRKGLLFRSANPDKIAPSDRALLQELGIRTFIDLRAPSEVQNGTEQIDHSERISLPLDFQKVTRDRFKPVLKLKNSEPLIADISNDIYLEIVDACVPVFRQVIEILSDPARVPVHIHCQVGKDRTGIITALILMALGTGRDEIILDFMKSNAALRQSFKKHFLFRSILTFGYYPYRKLMFAVTLRQRNIESVVDRVNNHYGGIEAYLAASGCSPEILGNVRNFMLEDA
jgi:protein-tyrosine phosphatase